MDRIKKTYSNGKEILVTDYSGCKGDEMIAVFNEAKNLIQSENKHFVVFEVFNHNSYVSSNFVRPIERNIGEVEMLMDKRAIVGISDIQKWILKGINLWIKLQIHYFQSKEEALHFLTNN